MEKYLKWVLAVVAVALIAYLVFGAFSKEVGATSIHTAWVNDGSAKWSGTCKAEVPACNQVAKGTETGTQKQECKLLGGGGGFPCIAGQKRTIEVSRGCEIKGDVCEVEGVCPTACGLQSSEVANGKGGVKVCEATPACVVPVVPEEKTTPKKPAYSQGPAGLKGDGVCQLEWKAIKGSKKVEIRYAEDGIFGNGYKSFETKDDGAEWLNSDGGVFKLRGRDSKTDWSDAKKYSC